MKSKRIYWEGGHHEIPCPPCPVLGCKIGSYEEFEKMIKERLFIVENTQNDTGWYPPVVFPTKNPDVIIAFAGSFGFSGDVPVNPDTGEKYRWALVEGSDDDGKRKYYDLRLDFEEIMSHFFDDSGFPDIDDERAFLKQSRESMY